MLEEKQQQQSLFSGCPKNVSNMKRCNSINMTTHPRPRLSSPCWMAVLLASVAVSIEHNHSFPLFAEAWTSSRHLGGQQQTKSTLPHGTTATSKATELLRLPSYRTPLSSTVVMGPTSNQQTPTSSSSHASSSSVSTSTREAWLQDEILSSIRHEEPTTTSNDKKNDAVQTTQTSQTASMTVATVFQIAIPAVAVGLCWPVLSMQDTSMVGRVGGTVAQAALHPAIAVLNYASKLLIFLYSGTATMVSSSLSSPSSSKNTLSNESIRVVDSALQVAFGVGCLVTLAVWMLCARQPAWMIQHGSATAVYTAVRACAFPAAAVLATWQTASLSLRRVVAPVVLTLLAVGTNAVANAALVPRGALPGAAWATVLAQYLAAAVGVGQWQYAKKRDRQEQPEPEQSTETSSTQQRRRRRQRGPCSDIARTLAQYFVPITTTQASRAGISVALDTIIVQAASAPLSAAHQIITSVYYGVICNTGDGLSLAAQTLAPVSSSANGKKKQLYTTMAKVAAGTGWVMAVVLGWSLTANGAFTSDYAVQSLMRLVLPQFLIVGLLQSWFATSEGLLLGQQDLRCVGLSYGAFSLVVPVALWLAASGAVTPAGLVSRLWTAWLGYAVVRVVVLGGRAMWLLKPKGEQPVPVEIPTLPAKGAGPSPLKALRMLLWSRDRLRPTFDQTGA